MKKIISVLLLVFMLSNSVAVFADAQVDTSAPSRCFFNDLSSYPDGANVDEKIIGTNSAHPVDYEFKGGQYIASRKDGSNTTGLTYIFYGNHDYDSFSFGFDIKFSGLTSNSTNNVYSVTPGNYTTVFHDHIKDRIDSGELYADGSKAVSYETGQTISTKTAWCFGKSGQTKSINFTTKKSGSDFVLGSNGQPAVYLGTAELLQDTFYTLKVTVDQVNKKYNTVIITTDGTIIETGISGTVQNAFTALAKLDNSIAASVNETATITLDNLFVTNTATRISVADYLHVAGDGTISFSATLPDNFLNPAVYINNTFAENLTLSGTSNDYVITAKLPEGTQFGPGSVEVRGTCNGEAISLSADTYFTKFFENSSYYSETPDPSIPKIFGLRNFTGTGALSVPEDNSGVWALTGEGQIDITKLASPLCGIVEFSFDFNTNTKFKNFRLRMTANTSDGTALFWNSTKDTYRYFSNDSSYTFGTNKISYNTNAWNTIKIRADFYKHKYYFYLNNTLAEEGNFTDTDGKTNRVEDVRMIFDTAVDDSVVYLDNFKFTEFSFIGSALPEAYAVYANSSSKTYNGEPISAANLSSVNFETGIPFDDESITPETANLVNKSGKAVNSSVSCSNGIVKAFMSGETLPDGDYKLIITENAQVAGEKLGLDYEIPISFNTSTYIISPADGHTVSEPVPLSVFAPDADKVVFAVNSEVVASFSEDDFSDSVYSCEYFTEEYGDKMLDVFIHKGENIEILSTNFKYNKSFNSEYKNYGFGLSSDLSNIEINYPNIVASEIVADSSAGRRDVLKATSLIGTNGLNDISKSCINFQPKPSNTTVYRRMVTEYDIKVDENTVVYLEIGASLTGQPYGSNTAAYTTVAFRGCAGKAYLFAGDGTILGTNKTFEPGKWYKIKHVIDYDNLLVSYYVNDELIVNDTITASNVPGYAKYPDWKENIASTYKYRIIFYPKDKSLVTDDETSKPGSISLDNCRRWKVSTFPEVLSLNGGSNHVIAEGTDKVLVSLTKPFDHDGAIPFDSDLIEVFSGGKKLSTKVNVIDGANFEISGLGSIAHNSLVEIKFSDLCMYNNATIDKVLTVPIYVKSSKGLCIFPLAGGENAVYAKYINESDEADAVIGISKYDKTSGKLAEAEFFSKQIFGRSSGAIYASLSDDNIQNYNFNAFLWNSNSLSPIHNMAKWSPSK